MLAAPRDSRQSRLVRPAPRTRTVLSTDDPGQAGFDQVRIAGRNTPADDCLVGVNFQQGHPGRPATGREDRIPFPGRLTREPQPDNLDSRDPDLRRAGRGWRSTPGAARTCRDPREGTGPEEAAPRYTISHLGSSCQCPGGPSTVARTVTAMAVYTILPRRGHGSVERPPADR